jgi:hypothetical protein
MLARNAKARYIEFTHKLNKVENCILQFYYIIFVNTQTRRFFMLKKIIAASAALAFLSLFACSSDDNKGSDNNGGTDQSSGVSSSSEEPAINLVEETISMFSQPSIFGTYPYSYTIVTGGQKEDLTQFWTCSFDTSAVAIADMPACIKRELMATDAVLQNTLTTRNAPLRYQIDGFYALTGPNKAIQLTSYNLKAGYQAALGVNVSDPDKEGTLSIAQKPTKISNAEGFRYVYTGGAHVFRAVVSENKFWFVEVPASASTEMLTKTILFDEFMEGTLNAGAFNLSEVTQFLWVVEYSNTTPANNTGSLNISYFKGLVPE